MNQNSNSNNNDFTVLPNNTSAQSFAFFDILGTVLTLPSPNPIPNLGYVTYNFTVDPSVVNGASSSDTSNTVTTQVNQASIDYQSNGGLVKSVVPTYAKVGDVLYYTVVLKNTGNVTATSVVLTDTIPTGTTFVTNSVALNGTTQTGVSPATGVTVGTIGAGGTSTVTFQVTVNTIPTINPIPNNGTVNFQFIANPSLPPVSQGGNSNQVTTQVNQAVIDNTNGGGLVKAAAPAYVKVGDTITYTIGLKNTGNITATSVVLTDTIPSGTSFVTNSVTLNGTTQTGASPVPPTGVTVGTIGAGAISTVVFQVKVDTIPSPNPIPNNSTVNYQFLVNPASPPVSQGGNSNQVTTPVNQAIIDNANGGGMVKAVAPLFAKVGDTITYTIRLKNTGNITATSVVFTDTIPNGTSFIANSVTLNGVTQTGASPVPPTGVAVGTIGAGATSTVVFQVKVDTIPSPNPIPNNSTVNYQFLVNPASPPASQGGNSNQVTTQINQAIIDNTNGGGLVKAVDLPYAKVGDTLTYTIGLRNTGNMTATNVVFTDTIPGGTTFVPNSVTLNGTTQTGASPVPPTGVTVGTIIPGGVSTVTFKVTVTTIPTVNPIPNNGTVNFQYLVNPSSAPISGGGNTNQVTTQVNQATIDNNNGGGMIKSVVPSFAKVGDTVTYTVGLRNTGNITATNVVFTDTIPTGTSFVTNSVTINGFTQIGANPSPPVGVTVGNIGGGTTSTVSFKVVVNTIPSSGVIPNNSTVNFQYLVNPLSPPVGGSGNSNEVNISANQATIDYNDGGGMVKYAAPAYVKVGDTITYTVGLRNTGNVTALSVVFTDTIPNGTSFIANSVTLNGTTQTGASPVPPTGVAVGNIGPSAASTVVFQVRVNVIPSPNPIPNNSTVNYSFIVSPSLPAVSQGGNSNQVTTPVNQAVIDNTNGGGLVKAVNPLFAKVGDTLTYTIGLRNTGNMTATSVVFTDTIPTDTTLVTNSVTLDGVIQTGVSPATGVTVGTIAAGGLSTVTFQVTVNTIPSPNPIPNNGTVNFQYLVNPSSPPIGSSGNTNQVTTQINQAMIDNGNGGGMVKSAAPSFVKVGDTITYTIRLKNTGNITATNVVFTDTIPSGTTFVTNSVTLNGATQTGVSPVPPTGVAVGSIGPGSVSTVAFKVTVNTIPSPNPIPNDSTVNYQFLINPASAPATGSGNSNRVTTQVNQATIDNTNGGGLVKAVDKAYAKVGDTVTYTIGLRNTGNITATNVVFTDTIPSGTTLVTNSVTLNGVTQVGVSPAPPIGVAVGTIGAGAASTVVFKVIVNTIPSPNPIPNNGTVNYQFLVNPSSAPVSQGGNTNQVTTQVNQAKIDNTDGGGMVKTPAPPFVKVGDTITYTIKLNNTGNTTALGVVFTDTIPTGTTFVTNSVTLNGATQIGADPSPPTGVTVGNVGPGATSTVTFQVVVNTIPSPNPIPNNSTVSFQYVVDPLSPPATGGGNSNSGDTKVNQAVIDYTNGGGMVKAVDKAYAKVGDTLTYTIGLKNTGNITATSVVFTDTVPSGTTLVTNSVTLNGTTLAGVSPAPPSGVSVGNIGPGLISTVTFKVVVNTIPSPNPIPNNSTVNFQYLINPASAPVGGSGNSNQVTTQINQAKIDYNDGGGLAKTVNPAFAQIGDTLTYTVKIQNTGNVIATNVVFTDTIPNGTAFVPNSVTLNGLVQIGANPAPPTGVPVGNVGPGVLSTLTFQVTVTSIPSPNPMQNNSTVTFQYVVDPSLPPVTGGGNSDTAKTTLSQGLISGITKTVDKAFAKIGDVLTYSVGIQNAGTSSVNNVVFTDTIPTGTTFIPNSVALDSITQPGANPTPPTGVPIGTIGPGKTSTVTFKVTVVTIPTINPIPNDSTVLYQYTVNPLSPPVSQGINSNTVTTQINQAIISNANVTKIANPTYGNIGTTITYTVGIRNTGNVTALNVVMTDTIPTGTTFIPNSVAIDGVTQAGVAPNTGVLISTIPAGGVSTVSFNVMIVTLPTVNPVPNNATINYQYRVDPAVIPQTGSANSNTELIAIVDAEIDYNLGGGLVKTVTPTYTKVGDTVKFGFNIKNTGNVTADNIILTDTIPPETLFVPNSVVVAGVPQPGSDPATGINVGSLAPNQARAVGFDTTLTVLPTTNPIPNYGIVAFIYTVDGFGTTATVTIPTSGTSNTVYVYAYEAQIPSTNLIKIVDKPYATTPDTITYTIGIRNTGNATAQNVVLIDTIPTGVNFIPNSVSINGLQIPGASPQPPVGVNVGTISAGGVSTVTFQVGISTIPSPNPVLNSGTVNYRYTVNPSSPPVSTGSSTNMVTTQVNRAIIDGKNGGFNKTVEPKYATISDIVAYTLVVKNTGNATATNVVIIDTIPQNTVFNFGSVVIDGSPSGDDPATGINISQIGPNISSTITFTVTVVSLPNLNPMSNTASIGYNYTIDPSVPNGGTDSSTSTVALTTVAYANLVGISNFIKTVSNDYAQLGDTLTYTLTARNTGNVAATDIIIVDTIPAETTFIPGSITINGLPGAGAPIPGMSIPAIPAGGTSVISFKVTVSTSPAINPLINNANVIYKYQINPTNPSSIVTLSTISNNVYTTVNSANISMTKSADKTSAKIGETIQYSFAVSNSGNTTGYNVVIYDTVPSGTSFVPGSVVVGGAGSADDPATGINIPPMAPGGSVTVTFNVTVTTIPTINPAINQGVLNYDFLFAQGTVSSSTTSNQVPTSIMPDLSLTKYPDKYFAIPGDTIVYTMVAKNPNSSTMNNVIVNDLLPAGFSFIPGSVVVNGVNQPAANVLTGVNISPLNPNQTTTIQFVVRVVQNSVGDIGNIANMRAFIDSTAGRPITTDTYSNLTTVNVQTLDITTVKTSTLTTVAIGQTIPYSIVMNNNGSLDLSDVVFIDILPNQVTLLTNTFAVNGNTIPVTAQLLQQGVPIGTIPAGSTTKVTFDVRYTGTGPYVVNSAYFKYSYIFPDSTVHTGISPIAVNQITRIIYCGCAYLNKTVTRP